MGKVICYYCRSEINTSRSEIINETCCEDRQLLQLSNLLDILHNSFCDGLELLESLDNNEDGQ